MIEFNESQQKELQRAGWPPQAVNPATGERFVLIHTEMFDRVRAILEKEDEISDVEEMLPLASEVLEAGELPQRETA